MTTDTDEARYLALLHGFYDAVPRQAPGRESDTLRALAAVPGLPAAPLLVDFGCGQGAATLPLAKATGGRVIACDRHLPSLRALRAAARAAGLAARVRTVCADMAHPPLADASVDLIWSEGAVYAIGFAEGLAAWRPLLRPAGALVVSELVWAVDRPGAAARDYWAAGYPAMARPQVRRAELQAAGYRLVCEFFLPEAAWQDYYDGVARRLAPFAESHAGDPVAGRLVADLEDEIGAFRQFGDQVGYLMLVATAAA